MTEVQVHCVVRDQKFSERSPDTMDNHMFTVKFSSKHIMDCDSWIENQIAQDKLEGCTYSYTYSVYSPR